MEPLINKVASQLGDITNKIDYWLVDNTESVLRLLLSAASKNVRNDRSINVLLKTACLRIIVYLYTHPNEGVFGEREAVRFTLNYANELYYYLDQIVPEGRRGKLYNIFRSCDRDTFIRHFYEQFWSLLKMTVNYGNKKYFLPYDGGVFGSRIIQADPLEKDGFYLALSSLFAHDLMYDTFVTGYRFKVNDYGFYDSPGIPENSLDYSKGVNSLAHSIYEEIKSHVK